MIRAGDMELLYGTEGWICQGSAWAVGIGDVHSVPTVGVLRPGKSVNPRQRRNSGMEPAFIYIIGDAPNVLVLN